MIIMATGSVAAIIERVLSDDALNFAPDSPLVSRVLPSPNRGERRGAGRPDCLILHYTGVPTVQVALDLLTDPARELSSHYVIAEDGEIWQLVAEERRAWHAGASFWKGERDLNSCSIGIEIANPGHDGGLPDFPDAQIAATVALANDIASRFRIAPERVLAHSDIAPGRKRDPGERFPWSRLAALGIGHWVEPADIEGGPLFARANEGPPIRALQAMLAAYGYGIELTGVYDHATETVVAAFQRHFRPEQVDGLADASTIRTLRALIDGLAR
jgi:N-acetylmuramoyl-L-alanine amidase